MRNGPLQILAGRSTNAKNYLIGRRKTALADAADRVSRAEKDRINIYRNVYGPGGKSGTWWHLEAKLTSELS